MYNVPSRTGISFTQHTYQVLSKHPNINGVKEASGHFTLMANTLALCGEDLNLWSGNDDHAVPMMALGAKGLVSVASNLIPEAMRDMVHHALNGRFKEACAIQQSYAPLISALFSEVNPIPIKTAMMWKGLDSGYLRLPLCSMGLEAQDILRKEMKKAGILI